MAINSRRKGCVGEVTACHDLKAMFGWNAHRTQQRTGWSDGNSPDIEVDQTPDIFWEIKRCEKLCLPRALALAVKQAGRRCPVVMHRPNRSVNGWMLTLRLEDLSRLVHAYQRAVDSDSSASSQVAAEELPDTNAGDREAARKSARVARPVPSAKR